VSALSFLPEGAVLATAAALAIGTRTVNGERRPLWLLSAAAMAGAVLALGLELWLGSAVGPFLGGVLAQDRFALFAKAALLLGVVVFVAAGRWDSAAVVGRLPLAFAAALGGMVAVSAASLAVLWIGLEVAALASAAAVWLEARAASRRLALAYGVPAGLLAAGYLVMVAVARGAGFTEVGHAYLSQPSGLPLTLATLLVLAGLSARLGLAPIQWASIDRGQSSWSPGAGSMGALVAVVAALAAAKLLAVDVGASLAWAFWMAALAVCAVLVAAARAITAASARAVAGWLSVGQVGWIAAGLATHDLRGASAALVLTGAALVAAVAASTLAGDGPWRGLSGLAQREPGRAAGLSLALLSLAGVPPLAGFLGEFAVATELLRSGLAWVLGAGLLGWVVSTWAVLRVLMPLYLEDGPDEPRRGGRRPAPLWALGALVPAVLLLAYTVFANPIDSLAVQAATALALH
jgi:NADH-quinone oxidoreductase subunit N